MKLSVVADKLNGRLQGADAEFSRVSTDTRTLQPGDLFVALKGEQFDGHDYVQLAFEKGAVAAMVSRAVAVERPLLLVDDTLLGLGQLARLWSAQFAPRKVAITGSCGKTTLKEMVAAILVNVGATHATRGNLNNEIGVPLTLLQLKPEHQFAVIECGANHMGEIAYTAGLTQPDVAIVNIVAPAHLEGFGSIDNVARAKGEIYDALKSDGVAIINLDDAYASQFLSQTADKRRLTFALRNPHADVYAETLQMGVNGRYDVRIHTPTFVVAVNLPLLGLHNVRNALAATAIAVALGVDADAIRQGLQSVQATKGRLCPVSDVPGFHLIDDTYNANPASICAAIDVLAEASSPTCLVLGGMGELGDTSDALHEQVGEYAAAKGIQSVYSLGSNAVFYQRGYVKGGQPGTFRICPDHQAIAQALATNEKDKLILIKGSRSTTMEKVIAALRDLARSQEEQR